MPHTTIQLFRFEPAEGICEYHAMLRVSQRGFTFIEQVESLHEALDRLVTHELPGAVPVFRRYFLSDAANQSASLRALLEGYEGGAISIVEQPPLDGSKVALWVYLQTDVEVTPLAQGHCEVSHGAYRHLWSASRSAVGSTSEEQTRGLFADYVEHLAHQGCTLADHCLRTWFFVQNVDVNYAGVVKARNEVFSEQRLTPDTHSIASTGIAGRHADPAVTVQMDAYAVAGLQSSQVSYLYAPTHLNPTHEYGVSFERGTRVDYGDRRHVLISGTASIDNRGEVVHVGDIRRQTLRMWDNVEALLSEAEMDFSHVCHLIVYLRDVADHAVVSEMFDHRFPNIPKVFLLAPVCRPGWLIEMECMAVKGVANPAYAPY